MMLIGMRIVGAEFVAGSEGRKEGIHRLLLGHVHRIGGVGKEKPILQDHHREKDFFGDPVGLNDRVQGLLGALAIKLEPAGVPLREAVSVVAPDVPGGRRWPGWR